MFLEHGALKRGIFVCLNGNGPTAYKKITSKNRQTNKGHYDGRDMAYLPHAARKGVPGRVELRIFTIV
jgi:hypothetical protein